MNTTAEMKKTSKIKMNASYLLSVGCYLSGATCYLLLVTCHLLLAIYYLLLADTCNPNFFLYSNCFGPKIFADPKFLFDPNFFLEPIFLLDMEAYTREQG